MTSLFRRSELQERPLAPSPPILPPAIGAPSAFLRHLAGEFADDIARVWPAPHAPFLLADAGRRHLVCLALAAAGTLDVRPGPAFVARALDGSLKAAIRAVLPGAPAGLARALGRLGEGLWSGGDYRLLLTLLGTKGPDKLLRHAGALPLASLRVLGRLPPVLARGLPLRLDEDRARLLAHCYAGLVRRDGEARAKAAARLWTTAASEKALFDQVREALYLAEAAPPHPGGQRLRPLATRAALVDAARRYRNCLEGRDLGDACHYYEWLGAPPAVVCVREDALWGLVLDEAKLAGNAEPPPGLRPLICADLAAIGVHVGPNRHQLHYALSRAAQADFRFESDAELIAQAFG